MNNRVLYRICVLCKCVLCLLLLEGNGSKPERERVRNNKRIVQCVNLMCRACNKTAHGAKLYILYSINVWPFDSWLASWQLEHILRISSPNVCITYYSCVSMRTVC